jgi:hypothetical protein
VTAAGPCGPSLPPYSATAYNNNQNKRKSINGYLYLFKGELISWSLKRQQIIPLLFTEAEYIAAVKTAKEGVY